MMAFLIITAAILTLIVTGCLIEQWTPTDTYDPPADVDEWRRIHHLRGDN